VTSLEPSAVRTKHDTRHPLACCPRCHKAELAGRALRRPVFRYDKVTDADSPVAYRLFHGEQAVATLSRTRPSGPEPYEVAVDWEGSEAELRARTLKDARQLAEDAYTAVWRDGLYSTRGPVHSL